MTTQPPPPSTPIHWAPDGGGPMPDLAVTFDPEVAKGGLRVGTTVVAKPDANLAGTGPFLALKVAAIRADGCVSVTDGTRTWVAVPPTDLIVPAPY